MGEDDYIDQRGGRVKTDFESMIDDICKIRDVKSSVLKKKMQNEYEIDNGTVRCEYLRKQIIEMDIKRMMW